MQSTISSLDEIRATPLNVQIVLKILLQDMTKMIYRLLTLNELASEFAMWLRPLL